MDNRTIAVIIELFANKEMSLYELSVQTGVDKENVLVGLREVNELLEREGYEPIYFKGGLYQVPETLLSYQREIFEWLRSHEIYLSQEERQMLLYLYTFIRKEFVSNNHFQDLLGVSRNTVLADIKAVRNVCNRFDIFLAYTRSDGYHLIGQEENKHRLALYAISSCLQSSVGIWAMDYLLRAWQEKNHIINLKQISQHLCHFYQLSALEDRLDEFLYFLQYLSIRKKRVDKDITDIVSPFPQDIVRELWRGLETHQELSESWVAYLTHLLQGCLEGQISGENDFFHRLTLEIVDEMERLSLIEFKHRKELIQGLERHLIPAYARLTSRLVNVNAYTNVVKKEHKDLFEIVKKALRPLENHLGFDVPDSEVSYFVIHFGGYIEAATDRSFHYRALVVCPNGVSSSLIVKEHLKQLFPNICFSDLHSLAYLEGAIEDNYDMIFSTIKLETQRPFFLVPTLMTLAQKRELFHLVSEQFVNAGYVPIEIERLLSIISRYATVHREPALKYELVQFLNERIPNGRERSPMLAELITIDTYRYTEQKLSWMEAISLAAQPLVEQGKVEERYIDAMIDKVKNLGPFIDLGKGVAIPHARPEDGVKEVGMSMLSLKYPIHLLDDPTHEISLLICIAAVDNHTHLRALSHLTAILRETTTIQQLTDSKEFIEIADLLKEER
ncbi:BglG family transcription antiterminator [Streptococcus ruminantium]|uniref:BglG family transcription antiterminator n=1 Tax=Streptococcus ruminantium TaxID=1917441 RepID=UPI0012DD8B41|nr:BglG family transcription antiterminator [Streptococcus ruminantium]